MQAFAWRTVNNSASYLLTHIQPHMSILDVGCGPGTLTADFASLVPQGSVMGVDSDQTIVKRAQAMAEEKGPKNLEFDVGDVYALKFPNDSFDIVHSHQLLQHLNDPAKAIEGMRRVLGLEVLLLHDVQTSLPRRGTQTFQCLTVGRTFASVSSDPMATSLTLVAVCVHGHTELGFSGIV